MTPKSIRLAVALVFILGLVLALPSAARAATNRYVAITGSDTSNDCSVEASPCLTIQHAIDQSGTGDTIYVAAGTYIENLIIDESVALTGAGEGSSIVLPATSAYNPTGCAGSLCAGSSNIAIVQASNVTITGFTFDGDNPSLTGGFDVGGANVDARNGIITNHPLGVYNGLEVHHVTVQNIYLRGMYASSGGTFSFHHNTITNVQGDPASIAVFNFGGAGTIADNAVSHAGDAIAANWSTGTQFLNNVVSTSGSGVHTDNNGGWGGVADVIRGNIISDGTADSYGVWAFFPYFNTVIDENTVSNVDVALFAWGGAGGQAQITDNVADGEDRADSICAYVTTGVTGWPYLSSASAYFAGNELHHCAHAFVAEAESAYTAGVVAAGNSMHDSTNGMTVQGAGTVTVNASGNWWGSNVPATVKAAANGGLIVDYTPWLDTGTDTSGDPGFQGSFGTLWVDDDSPQTGGTGRIQEGIGLVSGSTVNVAAGTYHEHVTINKSLSLRGAQFGVDPVPSGARTNPAAESVIDLVGVPLTNPNVVVEIASGVSDASVAGFTLNGPSTATYADDSVIRAWNNRLDIDDNIIDGWLAILLKGPGSDISIARNRMTVNKNGVVGQPNSLSGVVVSGSKIVIGSAPAGDAAGVYLTACTDCAVSDSTITGFVGNNAIGGSNNTRLTVSGSTLTGNKNGINLWGTTTFFTASNNTITGSTALGIKVKGDDLSISGNFVTGGAAGIQIDTHVLNTERVTIRDNDLSGNTGFALDVTSAVLMMVDASANWWGVNGPVAVKAKISGNADYTPWLDAGTDTSGDSGFQGSFSTLWVDDDSPQTGGTGRVQEGLNLVTASTVLVAPGTYPETATIMLDNTVLAGSDTANRPHLTAGISARKNNVTLRDLIVTGTWDGSFVVGAGGTGFTMERVTVDAEDVVGRNGVGGNPVNGDISITYCDFLNIKNWVAFDTRSGSGGPTTGADLNNVVFSHNVVRDTQGHINIRGTIGDPAASVVMSGNLVEQVGSATNSFGGILKVFYATNVTFTGNTVKDVGTSGYNPAGEAAYGAGFMPRGVTNLTVSGNTFENNNQAIALEPRNGTYGVFPDGVLPGGSIHDNTFTNNVYGVYVPATLHPSSNFAGLTVTHNQFTGSTAQAVHNGYAAGTLRAEENWWNSACGPSGAGPGNGDPVSTYVDYSPWWTSATGPGTASEGASGTLVIPAGATTAEQNAILACASGKTVQYAGSPLAGGVLVGSSNVTIKLNGATIGHGSPAFTITGDNVTILGPGVLDGDGDGSPAVLVQAGADNFGLQDVEVREWADGVQLAGDVTSFKVAGNWIHGNTDAGLQVDADVDIGGVVTIEGNLFKDNTGDGIKHLGNGTLPATYNSWGDIDGPASGTGGDGVSGTVTSSPFSFSEVFVDVDPDALAITRNVNELATFNVAVKVDAAGLYAVRYRLAYNTGYLTLNSATNGSFVGTGMCTTDTSVAGVVSAYCVRQAPDADVNASGVTVTTLSFTANGPLRTGNGPWGTDLDLSVLSGELSSGARGGVKVYVNNGGFGADSGLPGHTITDAADGHIQIIGQAQYTGFVDVQGRIDDSGAVVDVYDTAPRSTAVRHATATSSSSGAYTTANLSPYQLTIGTTYYLVVDRPLYLPTTAAAAMDWTHLRLLDIRPLTTLGTVKLLGGDANDDNAITMTDATCISGRFGLAPDTCGGAGTSDVNGDGVMDVLDLVLMGGNYMVPASSWTP